MTLCVLIGLVSCVEERAGYYDGTTNWVQFYYLWHTGTVYVSVPYLPYEGYSPFMSASTLRDTTYFRLHLVGFPSDTPRRVRLEPYNGELAYDYISRAEPGVDYVAFDDPEMEPHLLVPGDTAYVDIPVIVLHNPEKYGSTLQLDFKLVDSEDLEVGDTCLMRARLTIYQY